MKHAGMDSLHLLLIQSVIVVLTSTRPIFSLSDKIKPMKPYGIHHVALNPYAIALKRRRQHRTYIYLAMIRHNKLWLCGA